MQWEMTPGLPNILPQMLPTKYLPEIVPLATVTFLTVQFIPIPTRPVKFSCPVMLTLVNVMFWIIPELEHPNIPVKRAVELM